MNKLRGVRFLLLKHLWRLRGSVDPALHRQISQSLSVEEEEDAWLIQWRVGETSHSYRLDKDLVPLYQRGDIKDAAGSDQETFEKGERAAATFAAAALGLPPPRSGREKGAGVLGGELAVGIASMLVVGAAFFLVAPGDLAAAGLVLIGAAATEFWFRQGKLLLILWGAVLLLVGLPWLAFSVNLQLALLHFLDPDARLRLPRALLQACAAAVALYLAVSGGGAFDWQLPALLAVAVVAASVRWLTGTHFLYVPLVLPVGYALLAAEGYLGAAWLGVGGSLLVACLMNSPLVSRYATR